MHKYLLIISVLFLIGCGQETKTTQGKIPGSFHSLQMLNKGRAFPNADIPNSAYGRGYDHHVREFVNVAQKRIDREWEAMGPLNTTGRTLTLSFNPQNPNTIFAGSASGGLWRSFAGGAGISWERIETGHPVLGVSSIAFAPSDSMTMYIGTGEVYNINRTGDDGAFRSTRGSWGIGILKSEDGGVTWEASLDWAYENQEGVWWIQVSENDPNIVTAATTDGVYRSMNAGDSWEQIFDVQMCTDLEVDPANPDRIIVACGNFGTPGAGIYRTTDGGVSWIQAENVPADFQGKIHLDMYRQDSDIVYASIGNGFGFDDGATWLCRTNNFGETWEIVSNTDYSRWQGWFAHDVAVSPNDPDVVIPIGIDIWRSNNGGSFLSQESQGGVTLGTPPAGVPDGDAEYSHSDHHYVTYHPTDPNIVYYANDGGIFRSEDGGFTFASMNGGMQTAQFYHGFVVSPQDENLAFGGLQDNSTAVFRGDGNWSRTLGGDGAWAQVDPDNANIAYASFQNLNVFRSTNRGQSWSRIHRPDNDDIPLFIAPYAVAPSNGDVIYAGGQNIYKSENQGGDFTVAFNGVAQGGDPFFTIEIAPSDADVAYFGTSPENDPGTIMSTRDGGETFQVNETGLPLRIVNDMSVDPNDPSTVYAVFSGFGTDHVYRSEDYGITWESINNNLPDIPTNCIEVSPLNSDHLYLGNDLAVYFSEDRGESWSQMPNGLPTAVIAMDFAVSPRDQKLWIATHGNGTYRTDLAPLNTSTGDPNITLAELNLFPNPATDRIQIDYDQSKDIEVFVYDISGRSVMKQSLGFARSLDVSKLAEGSYTLQLGVDGQLVASGKMIKR